MIEPGIVLAAIGGNIAAAVGLVTLAGLVVAAVFAFRHRDTLKAAQDSASAWKEERDAEKSKADRLDHEYHDCLERHHTLEVENAALKERTDLRPLLVMQQELHTATLDAFKEIVAELHRLEAAVSGQFAQNAKLLVALTEMVTQSITKEAAT